MSAPAPPGALHERLHDAATVARDLLAHGAPARWELFAKASSSRILELAGGRRSRETRVEETGIAVRTSNGRASGFAAASGLGATAARAAIDGAARAASKVLFDPLPPAGILGQKSMPPPRRGPERGWLRATAAELERAIAAASGGRVTLRRTVAEVGSFAWILTTAEGFVATWEDSGLSLLVELEAPGPGFGAWRDWLHVAEPQRFDVAATAHRLADRVLLTLAPVSAGRGVKDLLLHPEVAAHLLAALAPLFVAPRGERDPLAGLLNGDGELAAPALTLVDSRVDPKAPILAPCDGEGLPVGRTLLVDAGVPRHRLACYHEAVAAGETPRGGAVRLSYRDAPASGLANLMVATDDGLTPGRLLRATPRALYVLRPLAPVRCDLAHDRYRIIASGVWLEGGRVVGWHPVVELAGSLGQLLRRIEAVGTDLAWHQTAAGMVGTPSILVRRQPVVG